MTLSSLGWNDFFTEHFQPHIPGSFMPARVALEHKHAYELLSASGDLAAECTGRLLHEATSRAHLPAVGDWVVVRPRHGEARADIHAVLPRRTKFSRRAPGDDGGEQIIATNIDTVFLVTALDGNFNLRRIERYLAVAWESGAQPVVVLNKSDLHSDPSAVQAEVESVAGGAPVLALSAARDTGPAALAPWLEPGRTVALLGSSGVGKSTLINRLLGAGHQVTASVSDSHGKGRHTTTHRELLALPGGAFVIDTPGMRELQLWEVGAGTIDETFADVATLIARCRFSDCAHRTEPGCAVQAALDDGTLETGRWDSYLKLQRAQAYAARKADSQLARETKVTWRKITKAQRAHYRQKSGD